MKKFSMLDESYEEQISDIRMELIQKYNIDILLMDTYLEEICKRPLNFQDLEKIYAYILSICKKAMHFPNNNNKLFLIQNYMTLVQLADESQTHLREPLYSIITKFIKESVFSLAASSFHYCQIVMDKDNFTSFNKICDDDNIGRKLKKLKEDNIDLYNAFFYKGKNQISQEDGSILYFYLQHYQDSPFYFIKTKGNTDIYNNLRSFQQNFFSLHPTPSSFQIYDFDSIFNISTIYSTFNQAILLYIGECGQDNKIAINELPFSYYLILYVLTRTSKFPSINLRLIMPKIILEQIGYYQGDLLEWAHDAREFINFLSDELIPLILKCLISALYPYIQKEPEKNPRNWPTLW